MNTSSQLQAPLPIIQQPDSINAIFSANMRVKELPKKRDLSQFNDIQQRVCMVLTGYAGRYKLLSDGRRLITMILVPGDVFNFDFIFDRHIKSNIITLTPCRIGEVSLSTPMNKANWLEISSALIKRMHLNEAITEEHMLSLGRRDAIESLAHLFCEMRERLAVVGLASTNSFRLSISQDDMADTLGVTPVHISRSLRTLRRLGLITLTNGVLTMLNRSALEQMAHFDPIYLKHCTTIT